MVDEIFDLFEDMFERRGKKKKKERREAEGYSQDGRPPVQAPVAPPLFCLECGHKNEGAARFCADCGALLPSAGEEMRCLKCNQVVPLTAKFCSRCGSRVAPA